MNLRCYDAGSRGFEHYGAKGVKVCFEWLSNNSSGFKNFMRDIGPKPGPGYSIDRFPDRNGDYKPGNVRWATAKEQANNTASNVVIAAGGESKTIAQWSDALEIGPTTIRQRLLAGDTGSATLRAPGPTSNRIPITLDGVTKTLSAWTQQAGISIGAVKRRIREGMEIRAAVFNPPDQGHALDGRLRNQDRINCVQITVNGVTKILSQWARETGLSESCIRNRIAQGWSHEKVISTPSRKRQQGRTQKLA